MEAERERFERGAHGERAAWPCRMQAPIMVGEDHRWRGAVWWTTMQAIGDGGGRRLCFDTDSASNTAWN